MNKPVALVVIYNHNFEKNIDKIKAIYGSRFSRIIQIMPFYRGDDPDVVGVYEASWQFNGYLAQALPRMMQEKNCSHYFVIGDDVLLHPELNEYNVCERLQLDDDSAFVQELQLITEDALRSWNWAWYTYDRFLYPYNRCEFERFIPTLEEARACCEKHGFDWRDAVPGNIIHPYVVGFSPGGDKIDRVQEVISEQRWEWVKSWFKYLRKKPFHKNLTIEQVKMQLRQRVAGRPLVAEPLYPLFNGFSDVLVIPAAKMPDFAHLCGVFAAARLFVEVAAPTALVLTMDKIVTEKDLPYSSINILGPDRTEQTDERGYSLSRLYEEWKPETLFRHPVKLSVWKIDI